MTCSLQPVNREQHFDALYCLTFYLESLTKANHRLRFWVMNSRLVFSLKTLGACRLDNLTKFGNPSLRTLSSTSYTPDTATVFDSVVTSRSFAKSFQKDKHVDPALIEKLLRLSQLAPSSFNLQPYKMILVQQQSMKEALADTMLGGNGQRVLDAPLTIVYLSDRGENCIPIVSTSRCRILRTRFSFTQSFSLTSFLKNQLGSSKI
jgi:Nitroreductase family